MTNIRDLRNRINRALTTLPITPEIGGHDVNLANFTPEEQVQLLALMETASACGLNTLSDRELSQLSYFYSIDLALQVGDERQAARYRRRLHTSIDALITDFQALDLAALPASPGYATRYQDIKNRLARGIPDISTIDLMWDWIEAAKEPA